MGSLSDEYYAFHNVKLPSGDADHVVIGPTGIFVIETKTIRGRSIVIRDSKQVLIREDGSPKEIMNLEREALRHAMIIRKLLGGRVYTHAILTNVDSAEVPSDTKHAIVLKPEDIISFITSGPKVLDETTIKYYVNRFSRHIDL